MTKQEATKQAKKLANKTGITHYVMIKDYPGGLFANCEVISCNDYTLSDKRLPEVIVYPN